MASYYNSKKIPFDFTPQIFRYLEKLIDIAENTWADKSGDEVSIDNYLPGEPKNPEIQINNGAFWNFLEKMGAVKVSEEKGVKGLKPGMEIEVEIVESGGIKNFYFPKTYLHILDIKKVKELLTERGKDAIIRTEVLELLARDIAQYKTGQKLVDLLKKYGVPTKMIVYPNTKWKTLFDAFRVLSTSPNRKVNRTLYKIIEAIVHPLFFDGDKNKATEIQKKYNEWLKYDRINIDDGKIYIGPTEEEWDLGMTEWVDSDGNVFEPQFGVHVIYPNHLAELWVLWNQIVVLVSAYQNNPTLNHNELEKIYLEIIGEAEDIIEYKNIGLLKKIYKRPFTSLATAHIEAKAKKAEGLLELIGAFLVEITALKPDPVEIAKAMEKKSDLIARITAATHSSTKKQKDKNKKPEDKENILRLEISKMPELIVRNIEDNTLAKGKKRKPVIELSFPEAVKWEKVILKIKEGKQEVEIFYDNSYIITADYRQLRFFVGKKQQKPDRQWGFLCALSVLAATDIAQATAENMRFMITENKTLSINNVQQVKKLLVERLQDIFKTHNDPFQDKRDYYEPKFTIQPEPALRREEIWSQGGPLNENRGDETDRLAYEEKRVQEEAEE